MRTAMIAITTSSSMSVNPRRTVMAAVSGKRPRFFEKDSDEVCLIVFRADARLTLRRLRLRRRWPARSHGAGDATRSISFEEMKPRLL